MAADTRAAGDASFCVVIAARVAIASTVWACASDRMSQGGFAMVGPVICRLPRNQCGRRLDGGREAGAGRRLAPKPPNRARA